MIIIRGMYTVYARSVGPSLANTVKGPFITKLSPTCFLARVNDIIRRRNFQALNLPWVVIVFGTRSVQCIKMIHTFHFDSTSRVKCPMIFSIKYFDHFHYLMFLRYSSFISLHSFLDRKWRVCLKPYRIWGRWGKHSRKRSECINMIQGYERDWLRTHFFFIHILFIPYDFSSWILILFHHSVWLSFCMTIWQNVHNWKTAKKAVTIHVTPTHDDFWPILWAVKEVLWMLNLPNCR